MERPTTRVLTVLELLQTHDRLSGTVLAERVGVDGRTLRRYISMLEELGIPITTDRGRYGGYSLVPGFKLPPMMFTEDEALALSVGLLASRGLGLKNLAPAVASASAKLERVMPAKLKRRVRAIDETVVLDLERREATDGDAATVSALSSAAQSRERVRLRYVDTTGNPSDRDIDPYGLARRGGRWYVVGHCHLRRDLRSFRIDRIESVDLLDIPFSRPAGFNALDHLTFSMATLPRTHAIEVRLHAGLDRVRREISETLGILEANGDTLRLLAQTDDLEWFARQLARLPFDFTVIRPAALREAVKRGGRRMQRLANRHGRER
jgi:predicted DNA-binding transcriptional regulator YafY